MLEHDIGKVTSDRFELRHAESWHGMMIYPAQLRSPHTGPTLALTTAHSIAKSDGQASASMAISMLMTPLAVDCRKSTKPCEAQWAARRELA